MQFVEHVELGKADVDAVQVRRHVTKKQDRQDAPDDFAVGAVFKIELAGLRLRGQMLGYRLHGGNPWACGHA
ncbi:hypothetical protein D3C86_1629770 [compost metagenome]